MEEYMKELIPNEWFHLHSTSRFVDMLNNLGVKAVVTDKGFKFDYEAFVEYAKSTPTGLMPTWLTNMDNANLKWLLGDKYSEIYKL